MSDNPYLWVDGEVIAVDRARLSPLDHGVTVGNGVFETMKVVGSPEGRRPFALTRHLRRLRRSAAGLGLTLDVDDEHLRDAADQVLDANGDAAGRLRITVTGGPGPLGSGAPAGPSTVIVASAAHTPWPASTGVVVVPWVRNERSPVAGLKTTSYAENVVALRFAHERGASEAVFTNTAGHLCEGTGSNIFLAVDGGLVTPPLSSGCLAGITRELVLELVDATEADLDPAMLRCATEVFLTSSTRDVHPVATVDDEPVAACPGPLTSAAAVAFEDLLGSNPDP